MSKGLLNEGCWAFPTTTSKVKALFTILKDLKNKSPKYVADSRVDPDAVQTALHNIFGDDDLFDTLNDTFTAEGVIFDVRSRLKEILGSKNADIAGLQKPALDALRKFASSGKLSEKKIVEASNTDKMTFTVNDDKLDSKLHDMFKDKLDYKDDRGDSWYVLDRKDFDRFIDYADSAGYDADYEKEDGSVIELGPTLDEENSSGNVAGFNTPQAFAKPGEKGNRGIDAMNSLGYTVMSRKGKSKVNPVNEVLSKTWKKGDILASTYQIVKFIKYNKAGDEYGGEDTFTGIRLKSKYPEDKEGIGNEFPDAYITAFKKVDPSNPKYIKESLNEIAYKDYKNLDMPHSKKVNLAINDVATSLYQIENFMKQNAKLMKEEGMGTDKYWASTAQKVLKISERIGNIKRQLKEFGIKEIADKGRQDKIDFIVACGTDLPKKHQWRAQDLAQLPDSKLEVVLKNRLNMRECDAMAKTYGFKKGSVKEDVTEDNSDTINYKTNRAIYDDEGFFKVAKPIYIKLVKLGKIRNTDVAFCNVVDKVVVANGKFMHVNWRTNAKKFYSNFRKTTYESRIPEAKGESIKETYYNKGWNVTSIKLWIEKYAKEKGLELKQVHKSTKDSPNSRSKTKFTVYDIGTKFGIVVIETMVEGAPRLNDVDVAVGVKGSAIGNLTGSLRITDADESTLVKTFDKILLSTT